MDDLSDSPSDCDSTLPNGSSYYGSNETYLPSSGIRPITPSYMVKANEEPMPLSAPRKLLVILDLNGTLVFRDIDRRRTSHQRPYLEGFLSFLFENCRVMIWSSARPDSIQRMLRKTFGNQASRLDRIWTRKNFRLSQKDYHRRVLTLKDLEYVWEAMEEGRSRARKEDLEEGAKFGLHYDQTNTVLIDDSILKSQLQPHNCIVVPEYDWDRFYAGNDMELVKIRLYLEELMRQQNVSAYIRTHPFETVSQEYNQEVVQHTAEQMKLPPQVQEVPEQPKKAKKQKKLKTQKTTNETQQPREKMQLRSQTRTATVPPEFLELPELPGFLDLPELPPGFLQLPELLNLPPGLPPGFPELPEIPELPVLREPGSGRREYRRRRSRERLRQRKMELRER